MEKETKVYISDIIENLKTIDPDRIFLIGSYANESYTADSDIDLVVILNTEEIPSNYDEKLELKIMVRECIYDLSKLIPIDLIIYTKGEFNKLSDIKTSFYNEIIDTGRVIYEKAG